MDLSTIIAVMAALVALAGGVAFLATSGLAFRKKAQMRGLVQGVLSSSANQSAPMPKKRPTSVHDIEELKEKSKNLKSKNKNLQMTTVLFRPNPGMDEDQKASSGKLFRAGLFTAADRKRYERFQIISPICSTVFLLSLLLLWKASGAVIVGGTLLGLFIGINIPKSWLERQIRFRNEEILYHLPLSMEQIAIGVSSALDIWPCIANILEIARERNTHTPMTELFLYVEKLMTSGMNFQDALHEVAKASGVQQVKHAFHFMAQVAEHGGEISRQLQELATAIANERETQIEGKIASLPVKATGPLFTVFTGYFILMMAGIFARLVVSLKLR